MIDNEPLSQDYLQRTLNELLEVEFSFRDTEQPIALLRHLNRSEQVFMLDWIKRVASVQTELGYQVACLGTPALQSRGRHIIETWALQIMDTYDELGLRPAMEVLKSLDTFAEDQHKRLHGSLLSDRVNVLLGFVHGLSGRTLKIASSENTHTDTESLFLPELMSDFPDKADNFLHYKIMAAFLWAQIRFGTFSLLKKIGALEGAIDEPTLRLYFTMESIRLEGVISRELPGLYREFIRLQTLLGDYKKTHQWETIKNILHRPNTIAADSLKLTNEYLGKLSPIKSNLFHGEINLDAVQICMDKRIEKEKAYFKVFLKNMMEEHKPIQPLEENECTPFSKVENKDASKVDSINIEILLDDQPLALPPEVSKTLSSILLDFDYLPDDYLVPAGDGQYDPDFFKNQDEDPNEVWSGTYHEEGAELYDEWDYQRKHFKKNWCAVREKSIQPIYDDFVQTTLDKYSGLIKHLRTAFEAMQDDNRTFKRQPYGDGIDLDALVEALVDNSRGIEMTDRLFTRTQRSERNIAVIFMVDMSGSTKGWINNAERESLILLCEALETLGDRYAIYGFSGLTRKRCEIFHIKHFHENYDKEIQARITGIRPQDYTRMGFAIRHLTDILNKIDAKTHILITLSDGKPDDYDGYRGIYGIEDTRQALIEARRSGVHPYCITIDEEAKDYLPHLYGPAAYTVISDVRMLPLKVSDIYRQLTTWPY